MTILLLTLAAPPTVVVQADRLTESSGLAYAQGRFWTHNDSGGMPRLFAFDDAGRLRSTVDVDALAIDWESLALFEHDGARHLLIADTGHLLGWRPSAALYVVRLPAGDGDRKLAATACRFRFAGGSADCEAVAVDARTGTVCLLTKSAAGGVWHTLPLADVLPPRRGGGLRDTGARVSRRHSAQASRACPCSVSAVVAGSVPSAGKIRGETPPARPVKATGAWAGVVGRAENRRLRHASSGRSLTPALETLALEIPDARADGILETTAVGPAPLNWVAGMDFSPDGERLAVVAEGGVRVYDRPAAGDWPEALGAKPRRKLPSPTGGVEAVCWQDGRTLWVSAEGSPCRLWRLDAGPAPGRPARSPRR